MNDKQRRALELLAEITKRPVDSIEPSHDLREDLRLDSAQSLELLCAMEEELEVDIPEVEAARMRTVQDILDFAPGA